MQVLNKVVQQHITHYIILGIRNLAERCRIAEGVNDVSNNP